MVEFIAERKVKAPGGIDWDARKRVFQDGVRRLHGNILAWLSPSSQAGAVELHESEIEIHEDHLGTYRAEELRLSVGDDHVTFTPVAALVLVALAVLTL